MRKRASRSLRAAVGTLIAGLLVAGEAYGQDQQPPQTEPLNPVAAAFDVAIVRPLGLVTLAVGAVFFIPVAVLTAPGGKHSLQEGLEIFVTGPAENVFQRPLGEF